MQNYRYEKNADRSFRINEQRTGYVIADNLNYTKARDLSKSLNNGKGFDGWTPAFFLISFEDQNVEA